MKKVVLPVILCIILFFVGTSFISSAADKTLGIVPEKFSELVGYQIDPGMYVGEYETAVLPCFASFGEDGKPADNFYYITITGLNTEDGAQYMPFLIPNYKEESADRHVEKTTAWLQDDTLSLPTGFSIRGVVTQMDLAERQYFKEYFVDNGLFTQEDIDQNPDMFSDYYIDTTATPDTYLGLSLLGYALSGGSIFVGVMLVISAAANKNRARYKRENAVANTANTNLDDSTGVPLGFDK